MKAWIARDQDGSLWLHLHEKPWKEELRWFIRDIDNETELYCDPDIFSSVKWEDEEPTEVEIIIKPKEK